MNSHHDPTPETACPRVRLFPVGDVETIAPCYKIKVKGTLEPHWANRFGGLDLKSNEGITTLTGRIVDQAALHGLITRIRDLGLPLLLVEQIDTHYKENKK